MSTVRYFYSDTTGYAEYMFRIYRAVEYRYAKHNDVTVNDEPHICNPSFPWSPSNSCTYRFPL